ncbi:hypothetical protein QR680_003862 [Steinernema hermaphroditum]|uniref:Uncharacterized protein n=1 Tax=Steinernema hermaphroditum TaxID=289476 RepID=A0AA39HP40_9BILA|nr:hypothetical protein QR680_003862 [Steinernema hermaphroditum]
MACAANCIIMESIVLFIPFGFLLFLLSICLFVHLRSCFAKKSELTDLVDVGYKRLSNGQTVFVLPEIAEYDIANPYRY